KGVVDQHRQRYLRVGGAGIDQLRERIADWVRECDKRSLKAEQYQLLAKGLGLADELSAAALKENQQHIAARLEILDQQITDARQKAFDAGLVQQELNGRLQTLQQEGAEVEKRPGSNLPGQFHAFRSDLAQALGVNESALPFVAELVQV
ncbi:hypothetical protein JTL97_33050, partial [Pseudomonas aeruginosa]|nr:hypothetical protein [Pseudomonas aeruginosa]